MKLKNAIICQEVVFMKKTLVIGSSVCDVIINIHHMPKTTGDENIISQHFSIGGCAYNVASMLRYYQLPYTLFSPIGTGIYGDFVKQTFMSKKIPISIETKQKNGCCYCFVDHLGERTFICKHGAEYFYQKEWFDKLDVSQYSQVYICGLEIEETTGDIIIDFLEKHPQLHVYFAPGPRILSIDSKKMQRIFKLHPTLHLNEQEILSYTKEKDLSQGADKLYQQTKQTIIVTLGAKGCYVYDGQQEYFIDGYPTQVVDTIGAGDSHIGTFIAQQMMGVSLQESLKQANQIASQVVGISGATLK